MSASDGVQGIDVSKWQLSTPRLAGLDFLFARASIGTAKDVRYDMHIRNARAAGLVTGAYHFNWSTLSVRDQVDAFLAAAGDVDFLFLDVEYAGNGISAFSTAQAREFIDRVHQRGRKIGLYMSDSNYKGSVGQDYHWVARWTSQPPTRDWDFWQWQGSPLDRNRFSGTKAQLVKLAGGAPQGAAEDMSKFINLSGVNLTSNRRVAVSPGQDWFYLDGTRGGDISASASVPVLGRSDSQGDKLIVVIGTAVPYSDDVQRPTAVLVKEFWASATTVSPAPDATPFAQSDIDSAVALATTQANAVIAAKDAELAQVREVADEGIALQAALRGFLNLG